MLDLEELIAALKRSSAPTLIVEGRDDYVAFNEFEIENISWGFTILPVSGVGNVEKIIDRINEIGHPSLAFLIDRDCAIFGTTPPKFVRDDTFLTDGYAIENDLLRDGDPTRLMSRSELAAFQKELVKFAKFFVCAAACHLEGQPDYSLSSSPHCVLDASSEYLPEYEVWVTEREAALAPEFQEATKSPMRFIKGKTLVSLFTRQLSRRGRRSSYSAANLLEIGAVARGGYMRRIEGDVLQHFRNIGVAPVHV